jgi:hypothetical protein
MHNRRTLLLSAAAALVATPAFSAEMTARPVAVVELFTSQGCNSCPPADKLLGELAMRDDVIALSLHVDYWDYLGWKDSFASKATTARQHAYARTLGERGVYTPQAVVGGTAHAIGSDGAAVRRLLDKAKQTAALALVVEREGASMAVRLPPASAIKGAAVWFIEYDARHDVAIARGENGGKTLSYHNVVRRLEKIASWDGTAQRLTLPPASAPRDGGCAVLIQADEAGPIIGAVKIDLRS